MRSKLAYTLRSNFEREIEKVSLLESNLVVPNNGMKCIAV